MEMLCYRVRKKLIPFIEGALDNRQAEAIEKHISRCERCAAEAKAIKSAYSAFRGARTPAAEPAPDLWEKIEQKILAEAGQKQAYSTGSIWRLAGATAAAALLLAGVITVMTPNKITLPVNNQTKKTHTTVTSPPTDNMGKTENRQIFKAEPKPNQNMNNARKYHIAKMQKAGKKMPEAEILKADTRNEALLLSAKTERGGATSASDLTGPSSAPPAEVHPGADGETVMSAVSPSSSLSAASSMDKSTANEQPRLGMSAGNGGRDWIECGKPSQTNIDILNNTDTQSRIAAMFRYP